MAELIQLLSHVHPVAQVVGITFMGLFACIIVYGVFVKG